MNSRVDASRLHERDHRPVAAGAPPQRRHEVRIRQAPDVEHQIGVDRHAVLEAEAEQRDDQAGPGPIARQAHEELPQLVHRHVRRVDDLVGHARGWRSAAPARRGCLRSPTVRAPADAAAASR